MNPVDIVVGSILVAVVLATVAQRLKIPYPSLLVLGGLALGFVPGLPRIQIPPEITFLVFLPPLVYRVAGRFGLRDLRRHLGPILQLSIVLVGLTLLGVAGAVHWGIDAFPWTAAFVLAAIVGPTDTVAISAVTRNLSVPRRVERILEGESLFNDVVALVAYQQAVQTVVTGTFSVGGACVELVWDALGGIGMGLAVGAAATWVRPLIRETSVSTAASLLTPFVAYIAAEAIGASGVLATVAAGLFIGNFLLANLTPAERLQTLSVWAGLAFLLEGTAFVLIGFQLRSVLRDLSYIPAPTLIRDGLLVSAATIGVRLSWVFAWAFLSNAINRRGAKLASAPPRGHTLLIAWAGMRGVDSLAAALALPLVLADGFTPFPHRDQILFLSFCVILTTLVLQGLTLPLVIRYLGFSSDEALDREETQVRLAAAEAALRRLDELEKATGAASESMSHLRETYRRQIRRYSARLGAKSEAVAKIDPNATSILSMDLLKAQRRELMTMWANGLISDEARQRVERTLDFEELKLGAEDSQPHH